MSHGSGAMDREPWIVSHGSGATDQSVLGLITMDHGLWATGILLLISNYLPLKSNKSHEITS